MPRLVIDTNLWISYYLSAQSVAGKRIGRLLTHPDCTLLGSPQLVGEVENVISRLRILRRLGSPAVQTEARFVLRQALAALEYLAPAPLATECRDPKDNYLLDLARDGQADFLLSGDRDLIALHTYGRTNILSLTDFVVLFLPDE